MNNPMMIGTNNNLIFCIVIERFNERVYIVRFYNIDSISYTNIFSTYLAAIIIKKFQGFSYCSVILRTFTVNAAALCPAVDVVNCPYIDGIGVHM